MGPLELCVESFVLCTWCFVLGALYFVLCTGCFVLGALCFVLCALCFVLCALCFVLFAKGLKTARARYSKYKARSTKHQVQSTKHEVQSTKHQVQSTVRSMSLLLRFAPPPESSQYAPHADHLRNWSRTRPSRSLGCHPAALCEHRLPARWHRYVGGRA
jgi:hypothetical protein